ncbi:MAG: tetratricopeptide repeat protein [Candidatus Omnitrophota bacterium]
MTSGRKTVLLIGILLCLGAAVYFNSIDGPLFWDDEVTVVQNVYIRQPLKFLGDIFSSSYHSGSGEVLNFYRPVATLSFALDYRIWGLKATGYHLTSVILHLLNGVLIFLLLKKLFKNPWISFLSAALFLVHPINSEAVNYVSNRTDLLMLFFFLSAFYLYLMYKKQQKGIWLAGSLGLYVCSVLSKEIGLVLPLFLLSAEMLFFKEKKQIKVILGFGVIFVLYGILRATSLNFLNINILVDGAQADPYSRDLFFRTFIFGKVFMTYLRLFFVPVNLHMEYDMPELLSPIDITAFLGVLGFLGMSAGIFCLCRNRKEMQFGQLWFILGLFPISGIIPINNVVSEHYLYLASTGFFVIISAMAVNFGLKNKAVFVKYGTIALGVLVITLLSVTTHKRNKDWQDPLTMYLDIAGTTKNSFRAHNNAGVEYYRKENFNQAEKFFRSSLDILPTYGEALNNLGVIYEGKKQYNEAEKLYKECLKNKPGYILAHKNLVKIYLRANKRGEAKAQVQKVLQYHPYDEEALQMLEQMEKYGY